MNTCPFCELPPERIVAHHGSCVAFHDLFPASEGHLLIIPRRHIASFADLNREEWLSIHELAKTLSADLRRQDFSIQGFNFGFNDGEAAGQTIFHAHAHLIPRRKGDVPHPRGGVRGVIPCKRDYPEADIGFRVQRKPT